MKFHIKSFRLSTSIYHNDLFHFLSTPYDNDQLNLVPDSIPEIENLQILLKELFPTVFLRSVHGALRL